MSDTPTTEIVPQAFTSLDRPTVRQTLDRFRDELTRWLLTRDDLQAFTVTMDGSGYFRLELGYLEREDLERHEITPESPRVTLEAVV